jgi:hypothetical protein
MPGSDDRSSDDAQKAAAEALRRQIDDLTEDKTPAPSTSLREFIDRKMAEDREKTDETDQ